MVCMYQYKNMCIEGHVCICQGPEHLPAYKPGGRLETFDIEELVAEGKAGYVHVSTTPLCATGHQKCCIRKHMYGKVSDMVIILS